jgi:hypothetical protein
MAHGSIGMKKRAIRRLREILKRNLVKCNGVCDGLHVEMEMLGSVSIKANEIRMEGVHR